MLRKLATAATIAALALLTRTPLLHAQKALVYCPVGVDATGCDRIVNALSSKFTEGVDRGYDGSAGTVDLSKVDLHHYGVFVVPSLADDTDKQPYALLRKVASRLHYAINGRVAVYSGAPDQGNSNRADKDALIQNLASWASDGHTRKTGLVGMVAFLDLSEDEGARYSWVHDVSLVDVSADTEDQSIGAATPMGTRGGDLLKVNGRQLAFSNMASNGLHIGNRGAARTEIGAIGGTTTHQSVLVTYSNADRAGDGVKLGKAIAGPSFNRTSGSASLDVTAGSAATTSGPTLSTNKPDYVPGDTVTFTGNGFSPGDTVTITVHVDSTQSFPDRQYQSIADANGGFTNSQMVVVTTDLNMFFTATAVADPSGLVAQTQFTDAGSVSLPATGTAGTSVTLSSGGGPFHSAANDIGVYWDGTLNTTSGTLLATCSSNNGGNFQPACTFTIPAGATAGLHTVVATEPASGANPQVSLFATINVQLACTAASIATNPGNTTKNALESATFSVSASGTAPTYQWQVSTDNGATFLPLVEGGTVSGSTTSTLTINPVSGTDNGKQYRVVVTASCGSPVTSTAATLTVNKINQTTAVTVTAPSSVTFGSTGTAAATGGDGTGGYTFSAGGSTGCSVVGTTVSVSDASGTCSLTATRAGDNNYNASAASAAFPVTLNKATQAALSLTVPASITFGATGTATTTGGSGTGAVTFDAGASTGCSVNASTGVITVSNASGTCAISAAKAGDNNYLGPISDGPKTVTLNKATQAAFSLTAPASLTFGTTGTATTTGGSGTGAVSFDAGSSTGCAVNATTGVVSVSNASGNCTISASKAGDNNYLGPVSDGPKTVTLAKAAQSAVTVTAPTSVTFGTTGTAVATGGDGTGAYAFDATGSTGCSVAGSTVSVSNASGSCTLTATRSGDNNYNPSSASAPFTVTLNKATQAALSLSVPGSITFGSTGTATTSGGSGGGAVTFGAGASTGCAVNASTGVISVSDASGTCAISASKAGDNNYLGPISDGPKSVTLNKATQTALSLTVPVNITFGTTGTATTTGGSGTGALSFSAGASTGCTVNATTGVISVTNASLVCAISASKAGDNNYLGPVSDGPKSVTLLKAAQTPLSLTVPASITYGTTGTATTTGGSGTGSLTFDAGSSTGCAVNASTGVISVSNASAPCSISASKAGDDNYLGPVSDGPKSVTLVKATQSALSLTVPVSITFGTTGTANTTGGSGAGALTFDAGSSTGCTVNGTTGVISVNNASGTCAVSASKAGDDNYLGPVSDGPKSVQLLKATQTALSLTVPVSITYGTTGTATTTGGSGTGALTFDAGASTGCAVNGSTGVISVSDASGTCAISASKAGDNNYLGPVADGPKSVTLNKATQPALSLNVPASITFGTTGTATTSGGGGTGAVTFDAGASTGCAVNANSGVISVSNASANCSITASKAGDNNYLGPVSDGPKSVTLVKANQSAVTVTAPASVTYGTTGTAAASGGDGTGAYSFSAGASTGCSVAGTTVSVSNASGNCSLTATRAGDNNYNASSPSAGFTVTLVKATQSITFGALNNKINGDADFTVSASASSGLPVSFGVGATDACTISGTTVHITGAGSCTVTASQGGNNNYQMATAVPQTFTIAANQAPVLGAISLSASPIQKGTALNLTSSFTDADVLQSAPYSVVIDWGDGSTPTTQSGIANPGTISASHTYSVAGVFSVTVSVTDKINTTVAGAQTGLYQYAVVYDPNGGFVTGGGWINSPAGACMLTTVCSGATGKANFGFVSKYQKGQSIPSGDTQFQFQAGGIDFHSVAYEWLVISGARAQYKGTGTINGKGHYGFILTAIDGGLPGGGGSDRFRIKIWDIDNGGITVYDNQLNTTDDAGLTTPGTLLGGGSIQIHN